MAQIGQFALALAWVVTAYSVVASLIGIRLRNDKLIASGRNAALGAFGCITTSIVCLGYLFAVSDFSVKYVAAHSNRDLPIYFKVSSIWGGMEGSLLFWGWLLTLYTALVVIQNWRKHTAMMPYVTGVLMTTSLFFTSMHLFTVNPFNQTVILQAGASPLTWVPPDGNGLNPLLQDAYMVIHPPMLYLGFVGFAVPFAFAMAAMMTRQLGDTWIRTTRRWTMVAWMFLSIGILLGGKWAYHELGWGGFWAWDPVENASLMPWLIGTAFLHSVMVQEKKGMLKVWNMVLVIMMYIMSIFGTFLTRSGIVNSVHAFTGSSVGGYFAAFLIIALSGALYLMLDRLQYLKSENQMESVFFRVRRFIVKHLFLFAGCFAGFLGHDVSGDFRMGHGNEDHGERSLFQQSECTDCDLPDVPDRRRSASRMAQSLDEQPEAEFSRAGRDRACGWSRALFPRHSAFLCVVVAGDIDIRGDHDRSGIL